MNLKSLIPFAAAAAALLLIPKLQQFGSSRPQGSSANELPGYTFPAPGDTGVVTNAIGEVVAENYYVGSAMGAYENAQKIRAAAALPAAPAPA